MVILEAVVCRAVGIALCYIKMCYVKHNYINKAAYRHLQVKCNTILCKYSSHDDLKFVFRKPSLIHNTESVHKQTTASWMTTKLNHHTLNESSTFKL